MFTLGVTATAVNVGTEVRVTITLAEKAPEVNVKVAGPVLGVEVATTGMVKVPFAFKKLGVADPPELNPVG